MSSGGPGDHPVADITHWNRPRYGGQTDALIQKIARLCSRRELYEWWEKEIGWSGTPAKAAAQAAIYYQELAERARLGGWEMPAEDVA